MEYEDGPHPNSIGNPDVCDYCGEKYTFCPCGLVIHWDKQDCPKCGKKEEE